MDDKTPTTRKAFFQKAGLALAGAFALTTASRSASQPAKGKAANELTSGPLHRIRPAQGTVQRKI
ncbi:hypothetical protein DDZ13_03405 [Coraliomargarita sinensis]|uniref:Uncharacterized protein n=1 Tax=Coraliomargarita sinensis TaxID=2174842 RepID=A0A317ZLC4_9BACT|nr:hypothetical protein DDZ13_03405 [Coraliomargarita sinensis]